MWRRRFFLAGMTLATEECLENASVRIRRPAMGSREIGGFPLDLVVNLNLELASLHRLCWRVSWGNTTCTPPLSGGTWELPELHPPAGVNSVTAWLDGPSKAMASAAFVVAPCDADDDFRGDERCALPSLFYVHVPRTGGTTVWAAMPEVFRNRVFGPVGDRPCLRRVGVAPPVFVDHLSIPEIIDCGLVHHSYFERRDVEVLCTARDPFERFASLWRLWAADSPTADDIIERCDRGWFEPPNGTRSGRVVHCRPQTDLTHPSGRDETVCGNIVRTEDIDTLGRAILARHDITLVPERHFRRSEHEGRTFALLSRHRAWIEHRYRRDFDLLGFATGAS